jgi:hypothetical protein
MRTPRFNADDLAHDNDEGSSRGGLLFGRKRLKQLHGLGPQASRSINDVFVSRTWLNDAGAHMTSRNER